ADDARGAERAGARALRADDRDPEGRRLEHRGVVRAVPDDGRPPGAELPQDRELLLAAARAARGDAELAGDLLQRAERVGRDEQDAEARGHGGEPFGDAVDQAA